ncbi:MAG: uracil-DNA glycosylase [Candidatus Adiutrix sp.]|jgi:hypothetical protein|nr:uracil-DNA glycosylase [Candidatus Adiutrix sp.]
MKGLQVNCRHCRHYYITWQPKNPHGCRAMGFMSRLTPSAYVYQSSGRACQMFAPKTTIQEKM